MHKKFCIFKPETGDLYGHGHSYDSVRMFSTVFRCGGHLLLMKRSNCGILTNKVKKIDGIHAEGKIPEELKKY